MPTTANDIPTCLASTLSLTRPAPGSAVILTARRLLAPAALAASIGSVKPKSARSEERRVGYGGGTGWSAPEGAGGTEVAVTGMVLGVGWRSWPRLDVWRLSSY